MKNAMTFFPPVVRSTQSPIQLDAYDQSLELYNQGQHKQAFHSLLDYLNPDFRQKYGNEDGTEFHIPHGSILVHIRISESGFDISADFLTLPEKGRIAMLRQVAELNTNKLLLPRFVKDGDSLRMEYSCALAMSHPNKMYFILKNICLVGDKYDDEFCAKFGAVRCNEPQVTPYSQQEIDQVYEGIQTVCRETLAVVKECESERKYGYAWNIIDATLYQISYFASPQGQLNNDLDKAVDDMDAELPVQELVAKSKAFLEKMQAMPKEVLAADLYFIDKLVSPKRRSSLNNIQENFTSVYEEAAEAMQSGNHERSAVRLFYIFYEAYFYNDMQDDINAVISAALQKASGKSVEEASEILYKAMDKIMEDDLDADVDMESLGEEVAQAAAKIQEQVVEMQAAMAAAMMKGDMAEYMRLMQEFQAKMMQQQ